jgi:hypothetical protein
VHGAGITELPDDLKVGDSLILCGGPHARLMRGLPGWLLRELERPNDETETEPADGA